MTTKRLYWEDVEVGDELPSYSLKITPTVIVDQVSGSQDYNLHHHNPEFARSIGARDVFVNTRFTRALLCRLMTDWIGDEGWLKKISCQMRKMNCLGDELTIKGKAIRRFSEDQEHCVECEIWIENDKEGISTSGKAIVSLPFRGNK